MGVLPPGEVSPPHPFNISLQPYNSSPLLCLGADGGLEFCCIVPSLSPSPLHTETSPVPFCPRLEQRTKYIY